MLDNPFCEEIFRDTQSKPPLGHFEAASSCPIACSLEEETNAHHTSTGLSHAFGHTYFFFTKNVNKMFLLQGGSITLIQLLVDESVHVSLLDMSQPHMQTEDEAEFRKKTNSFANVWECFIYNTNFYIIQFAQADIFISP